jgi:L-fuculose-phosphate aldolase
VSRFDDARDDVCTHAKAMWQAGLVVASAGNISRRVDGDDRLIAVTPASIPYDVMTPSQIAIVDLASGRSVDATHAPSTELPMHLALYRARPDVAAIVHTHAPFVTTLSALHKPLPPIIDEMMLYFGGTIEVADYAFTGTDELGANVLRALGDRSGAILSNHGNVCIGPTIARALHVALTMEATARVYVQALAIGEPVPLPDSAIAAGRAIYDARRNG